MLTVVFASNLLSSENQEISGYTYLHMCMYVCIYVCMPIFICIYVYTYLYMNVCA